jgi:hypothetical protein
MDDLRDRRAPRLGVVDIEAPDPKNENGPIRLVLTPDEALVLFEFVARGHYDRGDDYSTIEDQAELQVLWDLRALLEARLVAPLQPDFDKQLAAARAVVRDTDSN